MNPAPALQPREAIVFEVVGKCVSLKNSRNTAINRRTGQMFPSKNKALRAFEAACQAQIPRKARKGLTGPVGLTVDVFYPDRRQDLDVAVVMDQLEKCGVIENDRQVIELHAYRHVDRDKPRVQVIVREL